jgi:hypothetical protein
MAGNLVLRFWGGTRMFDGGYGGNGLVALEVAVAFWAEDDRESPGPFRREGIDDDIFDPFGVVT